MITATSAAASLATIVGGVLVFGDSLGSDPLIVVGRMDEAMDALLAWEAAEGRDEPTARLAFYLIALRYAAVLEPGADATTVDEFRRVAEAYVTGGGEYADMVGPWIQSTAGMVVR